MKLDDGKTNTYLGYVALGLFFMNLGYFINKYAKPVSIELINGLKAGACVGLMIIGMVLFAYGIVNIIKQNRKK